MDWQPIITFLCYTGWLIACAYTVGFYRGKGKGEKTENHYHVSTGHFNVMPGATLSTNLPKSQND